MLPFGRFPRADSLLGPEMKSTGEVMGVAQDYPTAFGKAQAAAGAQLPAGGTVFISVTDGDKPTATQLAASLHDLGFTIMATGGTAQAIRRMGVPVERIQKLSEGSPNVVEAIEAGEVDLVVNTPDRLGRARRRLRDPPRRRRPRRALHHHDERRQRRPAGHPRRARGGAAGGLAAGAAPGASEAGPAHVSERTQCPPERRVAEVKGVRRLGAYDLITARDPVGPEDPRPGQFYMLAAGDRWGGGAASARSCRAPSRTPAPAGTWAAGWSWTSCWRTWAPAPAGWAS